MKKTKENQLRVWWIPQVPGKPFNIDVETPLQAKQILKILADYDIFQYDNKIKPDYSNAGGLEVFVGGEWEEWSDDEGNDIDDTNI